MASNKVLVFQAIAQDPTNPNKYFQFRFVLNGGGTGYDLYVVEQTTNGAPGLASQVIAGGLPAGGSSAGGVAIGSPVTGGTPNQVLFVDGAGDLADNSGLTFDETTLEFFAGDPTQATANLIVDPFNDLINLLCGAAQETGIMIASSDAFIIADNGQAGLGIPGTSPHSIVADVTDGILIDSPISITFPADVRQIFVPGATVAGLNVGAVAADPSTPIDADVWYNTADNALRARINGNTVDLGGGAGDSFPGVPPVTGVLYVQAIKQTTGAGDLDIYTCPANKKAIVGLINCFNPTAGAITAHIRVNDGGTTYRMGANSAIGAGASGFLGTNNVFVLEAGQKLVVNATATGLNIFPMVTEFDDSVGIRSIRANALANGDNTIYTCPPGKTALPFNASINNNPVYVGGGIGVANESGGSLNYIGYAVPSGQVVGSAFQVAALTAIGNNVYNNTSINIPILSAGDFVVLNTSAGTAGQSANLIVIEI